MGMAAHAPTTKRKCAYLITEHAIEQLRHRFKQETTHRTNTDLVHRIDESIVYAIKKNEYLDVLDQDERVKVVFLRSLYEDLWALIKPNRNPGEYEEAVVTLLTGRQVRSSINSKRWILVEEGKHRFLAF